MGIEVDFRLRSSGMEEIAALYTKHAERFDSARSRELREQAYLDAALSAMPAQSRVLDLGLWRGRADRTVLR